MFVERLSGIYIVPCASDLPMYRLRPKFSNVSIQQTQLDFDFAKLKPLTLFLPLC